MCQNSKLKYQTQPERERDAHVMKPKINGCVVDAHMNRPSANNEFVFSVYMFCIHKQLLYSLCSQSSFCQVCFCSSKYEHSRRRDALFRLIKKIFGKTICVCTFCFLFVLLVFAFTSKNFRRCVTLNSSTGHFFV